MIVTACLVPVGAVIAAGRTASVTSPCYSHVIFAKTGMPEDAICCKT
ncbi:MAG: hypothetical protein PHT99_06480 [Methanoregula sp.]|nr:hypothetical protein [Methanoregula sp.]